MSEKPQVTEAKLADLLEDDENANMGTDRGLGMLDKSLRDLGAGRSILLDKHGRVIAGNKTRNQALAVGMEDVLIVPSDGTKLIAVQRTDLDLTTDPKARELAYADNRVAELDLNWKVEQIVQDMEKGVDLSGYFYDDELDRMVAGVVDDEEKAKAEAAEAAPGMDLQPFEHYDYMVLVFRNTFDWTSAVEQLGLEKKGFAITADGKKQKIGLCRVIDGGKVLALLSKGQGTV